MKIANTLLFFSITSIFIFLYQLLDYFTAEKFNMNNFDLMIFTFIFTVSLTTLSLF